MSFTGKIMTFFADKEKTLPAFPRTKIKAVSDDNGVGLDAILSEIDGKFEALEEELAVSKILLGVE